MLFSSYEFLFAFLPLTLTGYFLVARWGREPAIAWLVMSSLFFYGWWNPVYLLLIVGSMLVNFGLGQVLNRRAGRQGHSGRIWLVAGITFNLGLIAYFKYANFAVNTVNDLAGTSLYLEHIVLPLAISFFTFQQIAYLVDARKGITREYSFLHYALFVTFFPQLIAGPIVHHKDMLPQFMRADAMKPFASNMAIGLTIFAIGLFKKTVLADGVAQYATPAFDAAARGDALSLFTAWGGALAYTLQLYFDFSGYSDMAIGGARIFGIKLPLNFHSPYRATSIVEFWRRWHMTLSQFLRDYLYIALGGNRGSSLHRYRNLLLTMLLGGLWHGAGWTFVIWGGLHGIYLTVNHLWRRVAPGFGSHDQGNVLTRSFGWLVTFIAVVIGWVFFRAADFATAVSMLAGMAGMHGVALPNGVAVRLGDYWGPFEAMGMSTYLGGGADFVQTWLWIVLLLPVALFFPNTQQIMRTTDPALNAHVCRPSDELPMPGALSNLTWKPDWRWAIAIGVMSTAAVLAMTRVSEFLYFQF
ncbi:MAG: MBOAT family protein [Rhodoferax sp.]|nr:MBOAT family protein [Rhodoferax sp.]